MGTHPAPSMEPTVGVQLLLMLAMLVTLPTQLLIMPLYPLLSGDLFGKRDKNFQWEDNKSGNRRLDNQMKKENTTKTMTMNPNSTEKTRHNTIQMQLIL